MAAGTSSSPIAPGRARSWWNGRTRTSRTGSAGGCFVRDAAFSAGSYDLVYDSGCLHHLAPHRRQDYVELVHRALAPGGHYGLVCFRPEGGSGLTDQQVYRRVSLGGGLGYSEDKLRVLWDRASFSVRVLRQMRKTDGGGPCFGEDFLWTLLAAYDA